MSQQALERALGKLVIDAVFRERFFANPRSATWEAGLALGPIEVDALSRLSRSAIARFSEALDPRITQRRVQDPSDPAQQPPAALARNP